MNNQSSCDKFAELLALKEEDLSPSERSSLDEHLEECSTCSAIQTEHNHLIAQLSTLSLRSPIMEPLPLLPQYRISIVIPILDDKTQNLQYLLSLIPPFISEVNVVIKPGLTVLLAEQQLSGVRIIKQSGKGKDDALKEGFAACTGDIIVTLVPDGSTNPKEIPRFVEALLAGNDFAKGSRFIKDGHSNDINLLNRFSSRTLSILINKLFSTQFSDVCYGYNAFWKRCLDYIEVDRVSFGVETMLILRINKPDFKSVEVPSVEDPGIHYQREVHTFQDFCRIFKTIMKARVLKKLPDTRRSVYMISTTEA